MRDDAERQTQRDLRLACPLVHITEDHSKPVHWRSLAPADPVELAEGKRHQHNLHEHQIFIPIPFELRNFQVV